MSQRAQGKRSVQPGTGPRSGLAGRQKALFETGMAGEGVAPAPLADRMRPRALEEFVGQEHIVGPGRLLRRAIEADQLSSLIFCGPPGSGKTTLARIIANTTQAHFVTLNAVLAGVADIRRAVQEASERRRTEGRRTILFVDEVHRFNRAQQDALLPWVENGTVVLIGATTENPYFEVNKALVSRSRIFQLRRLSKDDLGTVARMALTDPERGYGRLAVRIDDDALEHVIDVADGDARGVLNALELAVQTTPPRPDGVIHIDLAVAEESIQKRAVLYDKEGDVHYDTASAFIKSLRGSDRDAALYWLARMVYAGEAPRFIFRRMLILAAEDVGLADPQAIGVITACAQAFDYVGLPEGQFHLALAALYLATAEKSNSVLGYFDALSAVEGEWSEEVPAALKDASRDREGFGHGAGYVYPHAYRDHWVAQQYLPPSLQGRIFYRPSASGLEGRLGERISRRREAQLAAILEGQGDAPLEILTYAGKAVSTLRERWLARAAGQVPERLAACRDRILDGAQLSRQARVLDLRAASGLLTWEALRRAAEGGVWALVADEHQAEALSAQASFLPHAERPQIIVAAIPELAEAMDRAGCAAVRFDAVVGRNALGALAPSEWPVALSGIRAQMSPGARLSLAETVHRRGTRPSCLLPPHVAEDLRQRVAMAEERLLREDARFAWDVADLENALAAAGFAAVEARAETETTSIRVGKQVIDRWFEGDGPMARELARVLSGDEREQLRALLEEMAGRGPAEWRTATVFLTARCPA